MSIEKPKSDDLINLNKNFLNTKIKFESCKREASPHSLKRQEERKIPSELIAETLLSPDYIFNTHLDRKMIFKKFEKNYLKVIYKKEGDGIIIITQHWETKPNFKKYELNNK